LASAKWIFRRFVARALLKASALETHKGSGQFLISRLTWTGGTIQAVIWSDDQKSVCINSFDRGVPGGTVWKESAEGSTPEKVVDGCGFTWDASPGGQYLLSLIAA
jgi:hypothetical protein